MQLEHEAWAIAWLVALLTLSPASALGQPRVPVGVLPFAGPGATAARREAIAVLETEPRVTVTDEGIADAAAERTGATASGPVGVAGFARQVQVRLVLQGTLTGRGARRSLALTARDAEGHEVAGQTTRMRGGAAGRRAIATALGALLDTALASIPDNRPREHGLHEAAPPPPPPLAPPPPDFGESPALLAITVSGALEARDAVVHLADATERTYTAHPYVTVGGRIELRPLAHESGYARGLYVTAGASGAVGLSSRRPDGSRVDTSFYRLSVAVGYLVPIGGVVEVGAGVGAGFDAFQLADNQALPTIEYPTLRPAIRARFRALGEALVIGIEGGYRALFSREGISSAFGAEGASFGWDVGGSLSSTLDVGVVLALEASYVQYVHGFGRTAGFLGQGTDGSDGGYRVALAAGYAFR